jgi:16S rRNA C967 or C1407 C5-methylase (RsmB/RsmF family)
MIPPVCSFPSKEDVVLICGAAPGSKTTQLAQYMNNEGLLVANMILRESG